MSNFGRYLGKVIHQRHRPKTHRLEYAAGAVSWNTPPRSETGFRTGRIDVGIYRFRRPG